MEVPRISVAMATFNGSRYLPELLASLAAQRRLPYELVTVDDGSTDDTVPLLEAFGREVPFPVRILARDSNRGFIDTFFEALAACSGDAVAFCDQDDVWHPEKIERCGSLLASHHEVGLVVHSARVVDADLHLTGLRQPRIARSRLLAPGTVPLWFFHHGYALVARRELFDLAPASRRPPPLREGPHQAMAHDQWACFLAPAWGSVALVSDYLVDYRRHGANWSVLETSGRLASSVLRRRTRRSREVAVLPSRLGGSWGLRGLMAVQHKAAAYRRRSGHCAEAADCLAGIGERQEARRDARSALTFARAERYRRAATNLDRRATTVADPRAVRRLSALLRAVASGGYGPRRSGGLGLRSLLLDVALAAVPRSALLRAGADGSGDPLSRRGARRRLSSRSTGSAR